MPSVRRYRLAHQPLAVMLSMDPGLRRGDG
jgi:hypothetical protein